MANTSVPLSLHEQLGKLQQQYAQRLPERLHEIEGTWHAVLATPWDAALCARLQRQMHGLAGSGASFGFTTLSTTARSLELLLGAVIEQAAPPTLEQRIQIDALIAAVRQAAAQPDTATQGRAHPLVRPRPLNEQNHLVFVLDPDRHTVDDLAEQIMYYGYTVHTFGDAAELRGAIEQSAPAAVVLKHSVAPQHGTDVAMLTEELRAASIPLIFLSARSDLGHA
jgi:HPt (histidine-containing phosphotransfer) domain-containing protein